jgi:acyl-coenzyme A synthetase/AMP-(fatty) acid ligase
MAEGSARFAINLYACIRIGTTAIPLSRRLGPTLTQAAIASVGPSVILDGESLHSLTQFETGPEGDAFVVFTSGT